ncbi:hypothetical protein HYPSUDRAFT_91076 [Hypholoma sublateritium FD-334 SS-4]|uniref:Uncharacterized protein n=1 Tax=Hypholoma sublateritium (strain FD-334 SS-4) TaxID=945553 RepID=A0A0D2NJM1_HYPSF|nr:hypothetical protein HYPSUDRAFT_91076 [Hypholoma sublateritium FD-334 SS-4]
MSLSLTLDDRDPQLQYSSDGKWLLTGKPIVEYNGTTSGTNVQGATVTLPFNGTGVTVFGSLAASNNVLGLTAPQTSYCIDGGNPTYFAPTLENKAQRQILFFQNTTLSPENHTLVITNMKQGGYFYLDRVDLILSTEMPMKIDSDEDGSDGSQGDHDKKHGSSSSTDTSAIVGGVIGSLALIGLVITALVILKYYRKKQSKDRQIPDIPIYYSTRSVSVPPPSVPPPSYRSRH